MLEMKVELLDHTGNPEKLIALAAKLCYAGCDIDQLKGRLTIDEIERFNTMLMEMGHCYDSETEVLTSTGFKLWKDVTYDDKLACIDAETGNMVGFEQPTRLTKREIDEKVVEFSHKYASLKVTQGHRLYCYISNTEEKRVNPKFEIRRPIEIIKDKQLWQTPMRMKTCANNKIDIVSNHDTIYKLFGFFIGDGHVRKNIVTDKGKTIKFHIKLERKINFLKEICNELGYKFTTYEHNSYGIEMSDYSEKFFRDNFYTIDGDKTFPDEFLNMTANQFNNFIEGLLNSDGHYSGRDKNDLYFTTSDNLANKLQALCCINGRPVNITKAKNGCNKLYIMTERMSKPMFNDSRNKNSKVEIVHYQGAVYCATVSTGLLMIRRKGHTLISGNCSPLEHASFTFAVEGVSRITEQQLTRHRIASYSIQSGRYVTRNNATYSKPRLVKKTEKASKAFDELTEFANKTYEVITKAIEADLCYTYLKFNNPEAIELVKPQEEELIIEVMKKIDKDRYRKLHKQAIESARSVLPNSLQTKIIFTMNTRTLINFFNHRCCTRAQEEIRRMAFMMLAILKKKFPVLFGNIGASCKTKGYCPEGDMSCGLAPTLTLLLDVYDKYKEDYNASLKNK